MTTILQLLAAWVVWQVGSLFALAVLCAIVDDYDYFKPSDVPRTALVVAVYELAAWCAVYLWRTL